MPVKNPRVSLARLAGPLWGPLKGMVLAQACLVHLSCDHRPDCTRMRQDGKVNMSDNHRARCYGQCSVGDVQKDAPPHAQ